MKSQEWKPDMPSGFQEPKKQKQLSKRAGACQRVERVDLLHAVDGSVLVLTEARS